jgi:hypothetical protein
VGDHNLSNFATGNTQLKIKGSTTVYQATLLETHKVHDHNTSIYSTKTHSVGNQNIENYTTGNTKWATTMHHSKHTNWATTSYMYNISKYTTGNTQSGQLQNIKQ